MGDLIFVEGVPGTGKSTTAQYLARQLTHHGRAARWIYEEEVPNPFVPEMPADGFRTWEAFAEAHLERWQALARAAAMSREVVVADSFLLQRPVFTMLRRDVEPASIETLIGRFADAVAPRRPRLVHLLHPDPAASWRAIAAKRGAGFVAGAIARSAEWPFLSSRGLTGLDGVLAYWRAHGRLCDAIVSRLAMETLVLDVSVGGWEDRRERLCAFFGIGAASPPGPDPTELAAVIGRYRDAEREVSVELEGDQLVLRGVLWPSNPLLPVAANVFDVEAWPFRVTFDDGGLSWSGPRLWWGGPGGRYQRVAT